DAAIDLRKASSTYGKWYGVLLSEENKKQFYVPEGFAHGFLVTSEAAEFVYKCTDFYYPEYEGGIMWNDSDIGIEWPIDGIDEILLSEKDKKALKLSQLKIKF
ncbi:dTDP-4-dehydrorhamnose 3,5-epimerase family protein, partial [Clostridiaceae bacterium UIB06]|nr:dTDP-4-dehydrorhamnose 3,5-epimerase family protein [Clostridiaceae bacterium UIB06]